MFSASPESPPLFIVDPTVLSRQLRRDNNLCVSERDDPCAEVARRPIWAEVAQIGPAPIWRCTAMPDSNGGFLSSADSPLEQARFELSVPPATMSLFWQRM